MKKEEIERLVRKLKRQKRKMKASGATSLETKKIRRAIKKLKGQI